MPEKIKMLHIRNDIIALIKSLVFLFVVGVTVVHVHNIMLSEI